jgi:hypothetical protein
MSRAFFSAESVQGWVVTSDLNTLLATLHVRINDYLAGRGRVGRRPWLTDAAQFTLATTQVLLGCARQPVGCGWVRPRCISRAARLRPTRTPAAQ